MFKIFTHIDLDGISCGILAKLAFEKVDIEYCNYIDINEKVKKFIDSNKYLDYDHVFITDISVNKEVAKLINTISFKKVKNESRFCEHFTLIDHHPTSKYLEGYLWCVIKNKDEKGACSGASLFYEYVFKDVTDVEKLNAEAIEQFVETVRQYDTWEWKNVYKTEVPNMWNNLVYLYGRERFFDHIYGMLKCTNTFDFTDTDKLLLDLDKEKKKAYFEKKTNELYEYFTLLGYRVGVVFAEQYISELGNYLAEKFKELDFIILIGSKTISYRGIKDNLDLGLIAEQFGGGGLKKASGSQIDFEKQLEYIRSLF